MAASMDRSISDSRQCWICYVGDEDDPGGRWVRPCRCKGSTKWVHRNCLQGWIDEKQKGDLFKKVYCPQCGVMYIIVYPKLDVLTALLAGYDRSVSTLAPFVVCTGVVASVYWSLASYGAIATVVVMGHKDARVLYGRLPMPAVLSGLVLIPTALLLSKRIRWQEKILGFLNRYILPAVPAKWTPEDGQSIVGTAGMDVTGLGGPAAQAGALDAAWADAVDGGEDPAGLAANVQFNPPNHEANNAQDVPNVLIDLELVVDRRSFLRTIASALTLPYFARCVGDTFFPNVPVIWKRSLYGGIVYVLGKGILGIYYKRQKMIRQALRDIKDCPDKMDSYAQTSEPEDGQTDTESEGGSDPGPAVV